MKHGDTSAIHCRTRTPNCSSVRRKAGRSRFDRRSLVPIRAIWCSSHATSGTPSGTPVIPCAESSRSSRRPDSSTTSRMWSRIGRREHGTASRPIPQRRRGCASSSTSNKNPSPACGGGHQGVYRLARAAGCAAGRFAMSARSTTGRSSSLASPGQVLTTAIASSRFATSRMP